MGWFVDAGDVRHEAVADVGELEIRDERGAVFVGGEVVAIEHGCPELAGLQRGLMGCLCSDGVHAVFDGCGMFCLVRRSRKNDAVCGFDGAAAIDELGVDSAVFSGAEGQSDVLSGVAVVGGVGVVTDEDPVAEGDAVFGEDSGKGGDGGRVRFGLAGFAWS